MAIGQESCQNDDLEAETINDVESRIAYLYSHGQWIQAFHQFTGSYSGTLLVQVIGSVEYILCLHE